MNNRVLVILLCLAVAGGSYFLTGLSTLTILFAVVAAAGIMLEALKG